MKIKALAIITFIQAILLFSLNDFEITRLPMLIIFTTIFAINLLILSKHKEVFMEEDNDK